MQSKSLFKRFKDFVNSLPVGHVYNTDELYEEVGRFEESTWWKRSNRQRMYRTSTYQTYLKRLGALKKLGRKQWQIESHIPEWFNSKHVNYLLGYSARETSEDLKREGVPAEMAEMMAIPSHERHNPFVTKAIHQDVDVTNEEAQSEFAHISMDLLKKLYQTASESAKKVLVEQFPSLAYQNVYNFGEEHMVNTCWNGPLMIGHGLAPDGLEGKCLLINSAWEMKTSTENGLQAIYFVKK